jgi:hypothetical protein
MVDVNLALSDVLNRKEIYTFFSRSAFEKAVAYQAQGRVTGLELSDDLTHLRAKVRGSGSNIYRVEVQLDFSYNRLADLEGECSCPMAVNCKHVAATVLQALSGKQPPNEQALPGKREVAAAPAPVLPYEVTAWLDIVGKAVRGDDYPADQTQRLLYCLEPSENDDRVPFLTVSLVSARVGKGGDFGRNYSQPSLWDFAPERAPKYYRDIDVDILVRLTNRRKEHGYYSDQRLQSVELLQQIVATGRAF